MNQIQRNAILVFCTLLTTVMCLLIFKKSTHRPRSGGTEASQKAIATPILKEWEEKKYVEISDTAAFESSLKLLSEKMTGSVQAAEEMRSKLAESLRGFLLAFHSGNRQDYESFRFPPGVTFSFTKGGESRINNYFKDIPPLRPASDEFLKFWKSKYKNPTNQFQPPPTLNDKFEIFLQDYAGRNYYSNYFAAVCFDEMIVSIDSYGKAQPPPLFTHPFFPKKDPGGFSVLATFPNLGYLELGRNDRKIIELDKPLSDDENVFANCFLFVRVRCPYETYMPVLVRFYWSKKLGLWMVDDIVTANLYTDGESNFLIVL